MQRSSKVLMVTSVAIFLVSLDVSVLNVAFLDIVKDYGADKRTLLTWVFSGYNIAFAAGLLTAGRLADRYGRKQAFLGGISVFLFGSVLCGVAPSAEFLIAARVVQAIGGAFVVPSATALLLPEFPVERRSAAIGISGAVGGIAGALGPTIGGLVVDSLGWHWVFFINVPIGLAAMVAGRSILREWSDAGRGFPDFFGALLSMVGIGLLILAIVQGDDWGWRSGAVLTTVLSGVALLAVFVIRCYRSADPVLDLALLRLRFFTAANASSLVFSAGFFAMFFTNIQFMQGVWGYSPLKSGLAMMPGPAMAALLARPAGNWAERIGHHRVVAPGALMFSVGILVLRAAAGADSQYWGLYFPVMLLTGAGVGLCISTLGSASNAFLPPLRFAMGSAFNSTARQVGAALGIAVVSALRSSAPKEDPMAGYSRSWLFIALSVLLSGVMMLTLFRRPNEAELEATRIQLVPATGG